MRNFSTMAVTLAIFVLSGCQKTAKSDNLFSKTDNDLVGRLHYAGTAQISADTKAAEINYLGQLPATSDLRNSVLDRLATAPFRLLSGKVANHNTNDYAPLIRPLLEDLLRAESYAEMHGPTNAVPDLMLAVRLDNARAALWQTNLATVISAWTGIPTGAVRGDGFNGWELKKHHDPNVIRCLRAGDWVLFGWGWNEVHFQTEFLQRIKENKLTAECSRTAFLDVIMNWPALQASHQITFPFPLPAKMPKMHLLVEGQEQFTRSTLTMQFPQDLGLSLDPWQIPNNLIQVPFSAFTVMRGIGPWLNSLPEVKQLNPGRVPNQMTIWASPGIPFATTFAAPVNDASNYLAQIAPSLVTAINNSFGKEHTLFRINWDKHEITSTSTPFINPRIKTVHDSSGDFLLGQLFPAQVLTNRQGLPKELMKEVLSKKNMVYYGWESTQDRFFQWQAIHQVELMMATKNFPGGSSPMVKWLLAARPKLGTCATEVTLTAPNELTAVRNSSTGLSSVELAALEYWVDAPHFPFDLKYPQAVVPDMKQLQELRQKQQSQKKK